MTRSRLFLQDAQRKLDVSYVPPTLPHRENQIAEIVDCFGTLPDTLPMGFHPPLLHGPTGTGKTSCMKKAGDRIKSEVRGEMSIHYVHLNCAVLGRSYLVAQKMAERVTSTPTRGYGEAELLTKTYEELETRDEYMVLVLDDVDELIRRDGGQLLFSITRLEEAAELEENRILPILIMKKAKGLMLAQPAARSKVTGPRIEFPSYDYVEMKSIVQQRVKLAFRSRAVSSAAVNQVSFNGAELGGGDARYAIGLLQMSGVVAERENSSKVGVEHVRKAQQTYDDRIPRSMDELTDVEGLRVLLAAARYFKGETRRFAVSRKQLRDIYRELADAANTEALSIRQLRAKMLELEDCALLYRSGKGLTLPYMSAQVLYERLLPLIT
jgi:cell division control protein 6